MKPNKCCICGQEPTHSVGVNDRMQLCDDCWNTDGLFNAWLQHKTAGHMAWTAVVNIVCQLILAVAMTNHYLNSKSDALLVCPIMCFSCVVLWCFILRDRLRDRKQYADDYFLCRLKGPPPKKTETCWTSFTGTVGPTGQNGVTWLTTKPRNPIKGNIYISKKSGLVHMFNGTNWVILTGGSMANNNLGFQPTSIIVKRKK